jgi:hypothetical protein
MKKFTAVFMMIVMILLNSSTCFADSTDYSDNSDYTDYSDDSDYTDYSDDSDYTDYSDNSDHTDYSDDSDHTDYSDNSDYSDVTTSKDNQYISTSSFSSFAEAKEHILDNINFKNLNLVGENSHWHVSLSISNTYTFDGTVFPIAILTVKPKQSYNGLVTLQLYTYKGYASYNMWQTDDNPIRIVTSYPIPKIHNSTYILIQSSQSYITDMIVLTQKYPADMTISLSKATELLINEYYKTFGTYPGKNFTYSAEIINGDWCVYYDDNDGIGGTSCLWIDGKTGKTDGIKTDE